MNVLEVSSGVHVASLRRFVDRVEVVPVLKSHNHQDSCEHTLCLTPTPLSLLLRDGQEETGRMAQKGFS